MFFFQNKFEKPTYLLFKSTISCFGLLNKRVYASKLEFINCQNSLVVIESGYQIGVESFFKELRLPLPLSNIFFIEKTYSSIQKFSLIEFNLLNQQTFLLNTFLIKAPYISYFLFFSFISRKQTNNQKFYLKGRILNIAKGGYSIGIFGLIGFLPESHTLLKCSKKIGSVIAFYVLNMCEKIIIFSQKRLEKILERQVWKLNSRFSYIKKIMPGEYNSIWLEY